MKEKKKKARRCAVYIVRDELRKRNDHFKNSFVMYTNDRKKYYGKEKKINAKFWKTNLESNCKRTLDCLWWILGTKGCNRRICSTISSLFLLFTITSFHIACLEIPVPECQTNCLIESPQGHETYMMLQGT